MIKRGGIVFAVAALVALTGCSASSDEPLAAETGPAASASATAEAGFSAQEQDFIKMMKFNWTGDALPDESKLVESGNEACAQSESGKSLADIDVIDGEPKPNGFDLNSVLVSVALANLCPAVPLR